MNTVLVILGVVAVACAAWYIAQPYKEYVCRDCGATTDAPDIRKPGNAWFTVTLLCIGIIFWPVLFAWIGYMVWRSKNAVYICPSCDSQRVRAVVPGAA